MFQALFRHVDAGYATWLAPCNNSGTGNSLDRGSAGASPHSCASPPSITGLPHIDEAEFVDPEGFAHITNHGDANCGAPCGCRLH